MNSPKKDMSHNESPKWYLNSGGAIPDTAKKGAIDISQHKFNYRSWENLCMNNHSCSMVPSPDKTWNNVQIPYSSEQVWGQ